MDLPPSLIPNTTDNDNYTPNTRQQYNKINLRAAVNSNYYNDTTHGRSVIGIAIKFAGCAVLCKTVYQATVSLSSTEAEFIAACEAVKIILYVRSILDNINVKQDYINI